MKTSVLLALLVVCSIFAQAASAATPIECKMRFDLKSWSLIYKRADGKGVVTCKNGDSMKVKLTANGGGLTVGKSEVKDGVGNFSDIYAIKDVLGTYVQGDASVGAVKSGTAQVMTKGTVSLALAGAGGGVDIGVSIGGLTIAPDDGK